MPAKRYCYGISFVSRAEFNTHMQHQCNIEDETTIEDVWQSYLKDAEVPKIVQDGETLVGIQKLVQIG